MKNQYCKIAQILILLICSSPEISLSGDSPYPIIFVHGLNSDDSTWITTMNALSQTWSISGNHTLHAVLNSRGGDTTSHPDDVIMPLTDVSGISVNFIAPSDIYAVNFRNFWNRNAADPRIIQYNNSLPGTNESPSNQSAIHKQGYALGIIIDSVLRVSQAEKVILVGHSMGGLAIREYLQRRENGIPKWWVDPNDTSGGHKVAKVVTTGTPHLGTNVSGVPIAGIDYNSEAMRDMRFSYTNGEAAVYLFTNNENAVTSNFYDKDISCNGVLGEDIDGISSGNSYNTLLPLPLNLTYTYIVSNYLGLGTDLAVPTSRQWLRSGNTPSPVGNSDTLFNRRNHLQQTSDFESIIRGLDEPDKKEFAYVIEFHREYSSFITLQSGGAVSDSDYYKVNADVSGTLMGNVNALSAGVTGLALLDAKGVIVAQKSFAGTSDSIKFKGPSGEYFFRIIGNSSQNLSLNSHEFELTFVPDIRLDLTLGIEAMYDGSNHVNDTVLVVLRNASFPFNAVDSSLSLSQSLAIVTINSTFPNATPGDYFIQIRHRNSLETWSSSPVTFTNEVPTVYDFTTDASKAFGDNMVLRHGRYCFYSGDVDNDGVIDATDVALVDNDAQAFTSGYVDTDLDGNLFVDGSDFLYADNNAAQFVSVIRP